MKNLKWLWIPALVLILAVSFWIHAIPSTLPAVPEESRDLFLNEDGVPYLTEMDSYFYARLAREMTETGRTQMYNLRNEDPLMSQRPTAHPDQGLPVLLSVLAFWIWRVLSLFGQPDIYTIVRWMGPVLGSLAAVPVFFYVRRRTNLAGGAAAGLLVGLSLPFLSHTHSGFFDTDMLLCVLPLGFLLLELRAMQLPRLRSQVVAGVCSGLLLALLSLTWFAFYTYFWLMVLGGLIGLILVMACVPRCPFRRRLAAVRGWLISIVSALLLVFLFRGTSGLKELGSVISIFMSVGGVIVDTFPLGWKFIGEMQAIPYLPDTGTQGILSLLQAGLDTGVGALGGILPCLLALAALPLGIVLSRRKRKETDADAPDRCDRRIAVLTEAALLVLWLGFGVVLMRSRRRFTEIAALPVGVLAGLGVGFIARLLKNKKAWLRIPLCAVLALGICVPMALGSWSYARTALPGATDSLNNTMVYIRETQDEDAVVASWWDFGYFMQYVSRRRVIYDGGFTGGDGFYFLGHALISDDPAEMTGILRMVETSAMAAVTDLTDCGATQPEAVDYLLRIVRMDREEAEKTTPPVPMTEDQFTALLDKTHPKDKVPLLIVMTDDMIAKAGVISYYGLWDLETMEPSGAMNWSPCTRSEVLEPGGAVVFETSNRAVSVIARMDENGAVQCVPMINGNASVLSRLCVWRDGEKLQDTGPADGGIAAVLVEDEGRFACFLCTPNMCDTMLVRMFICEDRSIPGIRLLGSWENPGGTDPCPAERRIRPQGFAQYVQVWEAHE